MRRLIQRTVWAAVPADGCGPCAADSLPVRVVGSDHTSGCHRERGHARNPPGAIPAPGVAKSRPQGASIGLSILVRSSRTHCGDRTLARVVEHLGGGV